MTVNRIRVAFVCVHNSCRSQIAEALGRLLAEEDLECFSAGTALKDRINPDAVRLVKARYGVDMEGNQRPKLVDDIPPVDVVVTMGCNVSCPHLPCRHREDWGLPDPTGQGDESVPGRDGRHRTQSAGSGVALRSGGVPVNGPEWLL